MDERIQEAKDKLEREKRTTLPVRVIEGGSSRVPQPYTGPVGCLLKLLNGTAYPLQFLWRTIGPDNKPTSAEKHLLLAPQGESQLLGACVHEQVEVRIPPEFLKLNGEVFAGGLSFRDFQRAEDKLGISSLSDIVRAKQAQKGS